MVESGQWAFLLPTSATLVESRGPGDCPRLTLRHYILLSAAAWTLMALSSMVNTQRDDDAPSVNHRAR
jgi:hypothetical protein